MDGVIRDMTAHRMSPKINGLMREGAFSCQSQGITLKHEHLRGDWASIYCLHCVGNKVKGRKHHPMGSAQMLTAIA